GAAEARRRNSGSTARPRRVIRCPAVCPARGPGALAAASPHLGAWGSRSVTGCPRSLLRVPRGDGACPSPGAADGSDLPARPPSAEEQVAAVGLEPGDAHPRRHHERFQELSRSRIDSPQLTLVGFPGAVPEVAV